MVKIAFFKVRLEAREEPHLACSKEVQEAMRTAAK
jgi:hypothetical protein